MMRRLASLAAVIAFLCFALAWSVKAHQAPSGWNYDPWCCNSKDCAEIPDRAVKEVAGGWRITLQPGDHPQVKDRAVTHFLSAKEARPSPDGKFHLCLFPDAQTLRCGYAAPGGV
jgi:hypothetical protein